ncbi:hypothetical protein CHS0354_021275 [Potamilus streckersoni]|uniref:Uncharacterized protein n=1 Tax=Potamilus streckersoni TaxID=2493646 RepID=A0AAE0TK49_9BIVA|nr:hypothetical protein CHS0354_021275 [Potamilus streckersoni]
MKEFVIFYYLAYWLDIFPGGYGFSRSLETQAAANNFITNTDKNSCGSNLEDTLKRPRSLETQAAANNFITNTDKNSYGSNLEDTLKR